MSDLVERLRERGANWRKQTSGWMLDPRIAQIEPDALKAMVRSIYDEAADRIAELEAAIGMALKCTPSIGSQYVGLAGMTYKAVIQYDCGDPWAILRSALAHKEASDG